MSERIKLHAAVIGLGKVGSMFDEEPRGSVWSHVGAYLSLPEFYEIVAGIDPNPENLAKFVQRCPTAKVFGSIDGLQNLEVDVISIATPRLIRLEIFEAIFQLKYLPKVIICEKPLASNLETRETIVKMCELMGIELLVNYNRRYTEVYRNLKSLLQEKVIGELFTLTVRIPNRLWSVGSHALDLLLFLVGEHPLEWRSLDIPRLAERGEHAVDFICSFPSGVGGRVLNDAISEILIFEVDAVGAAGRLLARENGKFLEIQHYKESREYMGYLELLPPFKIYESFSGESPFKEIVREAAHIALDQAKGRSTGATAMISEGLLDQIALN